VQKLFASFTTLDLQIKLVFCDCFFSW
jgi:hypothetical protein